MPDGFYNIEFKIYCGGDGTLGSTSADCTSSTTEHLLWTETRVSTDKVQVKNGYFSVYLGSVNPFGSSVNWNDDKLWLSINVGGTGSPSYDGEMSPFTRFASTPYALNSKYLGGLASSDFVQLAPSATQSVSSSNAAINITQSSTGNLATLDATNSSANGISIDVQSSSTSQYALSVTSNNGSTKGLYVRADGDVGIGTTTPTALLHVVGAQPGAVSGSGTNATNVLLITGASGGDTTGTSGQTGGTGAATEIDAGAGGAATGTTGANHGGIGGGLYLQSGSGGNVFSTNGSAVGGTGGDVQISAGTGGNGLAATGNYSGGTGGNLTLMAGNGGGGFASTSTNGTGGTVTIQGGHPGLIGSGTGGSYGNVYIQPDGGKLGVGTSSPTEKLTVAGNVLINAQADATAHTFGSTCSCSLNSAAGTFGSQTARDAVTASVVYRGKLFVAVKETDAAGIYRYDGGTTWTLVTNAIGKAITGDTANIDQYVMTVFDDTLFIGSQTGANTGAVYSSTTADTTADSFALAQTTRGTFGSTLTTIDGISDLAVYNGALYVGTQEPNLAEVDRWDSNASLVEVSNTTEGRIGGTTSTTTDGVVFAVYEGKLYAGNLTGAAGNAARISQYSGTGTTWTDVTGATAGTIGAETLVDDVVSLAVYNGALYAGTGEAGAANVYKWEQSGTNTSSAAPTVVATDWKKVNNASGKIVSGDTAAAGDSYILKVYNGRLYAGSQGAAGDDAGSLYEYSGDSSIWSLINSTRGTFGAEASTNAISMMQEFNGTFYIGTDEGTNGKASVYTWTKTAKNSYALKFDSGSGNYGQISFVGTSNSASNGGVDGSFLFSHAISLNTGAFDYAEDYPTKDASLVAGDIVSIDPYNKEFVKQATSGSSYVGIVSERPGFRLSQSTEKLGSDRYVPIALVGRVPLNVSAENGPIAAGDPITVSTTTPGIGVKATSPGRIVGYAMEAFNGTGTGKIVVFVNLGHLDTTDLQGQEALFTSLNVSGMSTMSDLTVTGRATIKTLEVTDQATIGTLHVTGNTDIAGELRVGNHIISSGKQPTVIPGAAAGSSTDTQPSVSIDGTDSAGSVAITTGDQSQATGVLAEISFVQAYAAGFRISLTPTNASAVDLRVYAEKTDTGFKIMTKDKPLPQTQYQFDYLVLGTEVSTP